MVEGSRQGVRIKKFMMSLKNVMRLFKIACCYPLHLHPHQREDPVEGQF